MKSFNREAVHLITGWLVDTTPSFTAGVMSNVVLPHTSQVLWDRVKSNNVEKHKKQTALVLLSMVTQKYPTIVEPQLTVIINQGLNFDCSDPNTAYTVIFSCRTILNIMLCKTPSGERPRFPPENELFPVLVDIIKASFIGLEGSDIFIRLAREVVDVIAELCKAPNNIFGELLCSLFDVMNSQVILGLSGDDCLKNEILLVAQTDFKSDECNSSTEKSSNNLETENVDESKTSILNETKQSYPDDTQMVLDDDDVEVKKLKKDVQTDTLMRFLFLVGHIAFKYSQFVENYYLDELKKKMREKFKSLSPSKNASKLLESSRRSFKSKQTMGEEEVITESDLMAAADDTAAEEVRHMLDSEIVYGDSAIAGFSVVIRDVCRNPKRYRDPLLKCIAATALTQTMMVSSTFCNEHMQLLVTMLEKSPEESVRLSLVIAFGDLLFKFPNIVEPWTRFLYARLRDESCKVRRNTLLVLSHLVTNEMVKVKGQISEVALCIVDENEEIVDLAKRFFSELSHKGNTLYNVLPDIISHLSNPESDITVEEKDFEVILRYIMEQIQKEKQLENLVEKLCKRMKESLCERQWKDLAFCLSLMPWSDRSLRRLIDHAACFGDRLLFQPVATLFLSIVSSVTKSTKPGLKEIGAELNVIVNDVLTKGSTDHLQDPDETVSNVPSKTPGKKPRKTPAKTPGTRKTAKKSKKVNKYVSDSEEDETNDSSEDDEEKEVFKEDRKCRSGRTATKLF